MEGGPQDGGARPAVENPEPAAPGGGLSRRPSLQNEPLSPTARMSYAAVPGAPGSATARASTSNKPRQSSVSAAAKLEEKEENIEVAGWHLSNQNSLGPEAFEKDMGLGFSAVEDDHDHHTSAGAGDGAADTDSSANGAKARAEGNWPPAAASAAGPAVAGSEGEGGEATGHEVVRRVSSRRGLSPLKRASSRGSSGASGHGSFSRR